MTVSSSTAKVSYSGNGATVAFAVPFYFLANSQLLVVLRSSSGVETTQVLGTNYTVTGAGVLTGGTVTMTVAPPSGTTLVISRNVPLTQETDLQPNDRLPAETLEQSIDKLTMIAQQLDEVNDRTLKFPSTDSSSISPLLPVSSTRAGKFLKFDTTGAPTVEAVPGPTLSVKDFGAKGDGVTNDTAAIQAAIDHVYGAGGGTVFFPSGTYLVTSVVRNWTNPITVNLTGEGKRSTILKKFDTSSTPILDLSGIASMLEPYSEISEMEIDGNNVANVNGIRATNFGRWVLRNVFIEKCNYALYCRGGLVFDVYDCTFQANLYGYYCEKSTDNVYSNLVTFYGGQFSGNSQWGLYIKQAGGVHIVGTDISFNGTSGDTGTGGIFYDATMDDEVGYAVASIKNAWFEGNFGNGIKTGAVGGLHLSIMDTTLAGNFNPVTIGAIAMSEISNCFAGSVTDTIVIGAGRSIVKNCIFYDLIDNSTYYHHWNVVGNAYNNINQTNARRDVICGTERFVQGSAAALTAGSPEDFVNFLFGTGQQQFWCQNVKNLSLGPAAIGFYGTSPQTKQTITGSRGGNAALASLLTSLAAIGLITDSTTA
jgi:hypothetical protein